METTQDTLSPDGILAAVKQLPLPELEQVADQVIAIRAERRAPHLSADESALLARINQSLRAQEKARMQALVAKRDDERISPLELEELTVLTDRLELLQADRLAALAELASLRAVTLDGLMRQLGIHFPDHD
jgi:hypothetical protein